MYACMGMHADARACMPGCVHECTCWHGRACWCGSYVRMLVCSYTLTGWCVIAYRCMHKCACAHGCTCWHSCAKLCTCMLMCAGIPVLQAWVCMLTWPCMLVWMCACVLMRTCMQVYACRAYIYVCSNAHARRCKRGMYNSDSVSLTSCIPQCLGVALVEWTEEEKSMGDLRV